MNIVTVDDCILARLICGIVEKRVAGKYAQGETTLRSEHSLFLRDGYNEYHSLHSWSRFSPYFIPLYSFTNFLLTANDRFVL